MLDWIPWWVGIVGLAAVPVAAVLVLIVGSIRVKRADSNVNGE